MLYYKLSKYVYLWNIRGVVQYIMMSQIYLALLMYEFCKIFDDSLVWIDKA